MHISISVEDIDNEVVLESCVLSNEECEYYDEKLKELSQKYSNEEGTIKIRTCNLNGYADGRFYEHTVYSIDDGNPVLEGYWKFE